MLTLIFFEGKALGGFGKGFGGILERFRKDFGSVWGLAGRQLILILPKWQFCENPAPVEAKR